MAACGPGDPRSRDSGSCCLFSPELNTVSSRCVPFSGAGNLTSGLGRNKACPYAEVGEISWAPSDKQCNNLIQLHISLKVVDNEQLR